VVHTQSDTNWLGSLTTRFGYASQDLLAFAKIGAARMDFDFHGYSTFNGSYLGGGRLSGARTGLAVGAGIEYMIGRMWSVRVDHDYYDFGDKTYVIETTPVALNAKYHTLRAGLSYRLGWLD
jgi:outer membrane immunogenic protein